MVVICGPTASGKTALALALARATPATIINMDASQVYADIPILSAQPSMEERAQAPHRLFGYIDGAESCSAAHWAADARAVAAEAHEAGRVPVLVGGTGLYMRTLLDGIAPVPEIEPHVRAGVRALPVEQAYAALLIEDAEAALLLKPQDTTRIARALEVMRSTGRTLKDWQAERVGGIGDAVRIIPLVLLPPRDRLMARCDARFEAMVAGGALEEVRALRARDLSPALPVMRAIGVRELGAYLAGELSLAGAIAAAQLATRQYAKRQYTWFRNQCPPDWTRITDMLNDEYIDQLVIKLQYIPLTHS